MDEKKDKLEQFSELLRSSRYFPANLRLFLISEKQHFRVYNGKITSSYHADDFGIGVTFRCERGQILESFAELEFFVNEIIRLKLIGWENPNYQMLEDILEYTDFFSRIKILELWKMISGSLFDLLNQTKQVRNGLAHKWSEDEVRYKGDSLENNFDSFKNDMISIWKGLLEVYKIEQEKINLDGLIEEVKRLNQTKAQKHPTSNTSNEIP